MKTATLNYNKLRVIVGLLLIILIGLKVGMPALKILGVHTGMALALNDPADSNDDEKKAEGNDLIKKEKEKEFACFNLNFGSHTFWYLDIVHHTEYSNTYKTNCFLKINTPPPDRYFL